MWDKIQDSNGGWNLIEVLYDNYLDNIKGVKREYKIPKKIHQVWLGGDMPEKFKKCCDTIKNMYPDYEYKLWLDDDIKNFEFVNRKLYNNTQNFGAKSDILRYEILAKYGGIYMDTDFIAIKKIDDLLSFDLFAGTAYVKKPEVLNGLIGCIPNHPLMKLILKRLSEYNEPIVKHNVMHKTGPYFFTKAFYDIINGYDNVVVLPEKYFYSFPSALRHKSDWDLVKSYIKNDSYVTHLWGCSWQ